jgi:hypothetical protein
MFTVIDTARFDRPGLCNRPVRYRPAPENSEVRTSLRPLDRASLRLVSVAISAKTVPMIKAITVSVISAGRLGK